jgi:hypothetical protein
MKLPLFTAEWQKRLRDTAQHPWVQTVVALADQYVGDPAGEVVLKHIKAVVSGKREDYREAIRVFHPYVCGELLYNYTHTGHILPLMVDALFDYLTPQEQKEEIEGLCRHARCAIGSRQFSWGTLQTTRLDDTDLLIGNEGLVRLTDIVAGTNICDERVPGGTSHAEMKAAITGYITKFYGGGCGLAGTGYNLGDDGTLVISSYLDGHKTYPRVRELIPQIANFYKWLHTPDMKEVMHHGDDIVPHYDLRLFGRIPLYCLLCGIGDNTLLPILSLLAKQKWAMQPAGHIALWFFDPTKLIENPVIDNPQGLLVTDAGIVLYRDGETVVQFHCPIDTGVDHRMSTWDIITYRNGWLLESIRSYLPWPTSRNTSLTFGMDTMSQRRVAVAKLTDTGCKVVFETKGKRFNGGYEPPPAFVEGHWLTIEYDANGINFTAEFLGTDPRTLPNPAIYGPITQPALQITMHAPANVGKDKLEWKAPNGEQVKLQTDALIISTEIVEHGVNVDPQSMGAGGTLIRTAINDTDEQIDLKIANRFSWGDDVVIPQPPPQQQITFNTLPNGKRQLIISE